MTTRTIDLNCDYGEGYGSYRFGQEEQLLRYVTSVNIACGFHAGDPHTMREAVGMAVDAGAAIGAHPGLPDRIGFGRRELAVTPDEVYDYMLYQIGSLAAFVHAAGAELRHVKPHGALYHMANKDVSIAEAIVRAVQSSGSNLRVYAQSGSLLLRTAQDFGLPCLSEVFADRAYERSGSLAPRSQPNAVIHEPAQAAARALSLAADGLAHTASNEPVPVKADTICLHGDQPHAAEIAAAIREKLTSAGMTITAPN
ncbi:5-oxoprolinase subunit PxpA [Paenibacillus sp. GCM10023252]|uniref:5-oxoprolinase subunit PxpA n=1 Tax=Paenibacillus sp. GCM10023252 TaxID=3252649 RepID=UPI003605D472